MARTEPDQKRSGGGAPTTDVVTPPVISLPKGGGAIRGISEKFTANPFSGTGSLAVPVYTSPARSSFGPELSLSYDSSSGNGPFGVGWQLSLPSVTRKTEKGLPLYQDAAESDVFILSGAEDLVPVLNWVNGQWQRDSFVRNTAGLDYSVERYRPRIEGLFARIERWTDLRSGDIHWRSISRDNVTTIYGATAESRLTDPVTSGHVFSWLICESYDDKGNAIRYEYKAENTDGVDQTLVSERNRTPEARAANRYLKRIKYANRTPRQPNEDLSLRQDWLFELVLDYGEHYTENANGQPSSVFLDDSRARWGSRVDPFSTYRAGFELRTHRLCQRILIFHHFEAELGTKDYLVRAMHCTYKPSPVASFICSIVQSGYVRNADGSYLKDSMPPLEFQYSEAAIQHNVQVVDSASLSNLPVGLDEVSYRWVDLDGEGMAGILTEQGGGWFYKRNVSSAGSTGADSSPQGTGRLAPLERVATIPSFAGLEGGRQQLMDLAGNGRLDLVQFGEPLPGYFERTSDETWEPFSPFASMPNRPTNDADLKLVDVTGDGHADILISEDGAFTWYASLAKDGFSLGGRVSQALDEERGPRLLFADETQSMYLADMSGDGLSDLVRIRNGEVCYWPNLGYGRFGAKVTMDRSPHFDAPDLFDQRRIRLADVDGSGTADIVYAGSQRIDIYANQSGNGWSLPRSLTNFPEVDSLSSLAAIDLLGNGTACLVWSSSLPGNANKAMRFVDLMGQKPHLLTKITTNLGAETSIQYAPSTKFYLADKLAGRPWLTRLPFPVQVVERIDTYDRISQNHFVTRFVYHHGYFDGREREFRGFGRVDQWDTEEYAALDGTNAFQGAANISPASNVPPILTKTWLHTGAYFGASGLSRHFENEYFRESDVRTGVGGLTEAQLATMLLDDTVLPTTIRLADGTRLPYSLSAAEGLEASRALKGTMLRQELYAVDGTAAAARPYSVSERNSTVELIQGRGPNRHAVLFGHSRETIDFHYDRNVYNVSSQLAMDPRVSHSMTLAVDNFGNVESSVAIAYGRRLADSDPSLSASDRDIQNRVLLTYTETDHTNGIFSDAAYRTPLPSQVRTYELIRVSPDAAQPGVTNLFRFEELRSKVASAADGLHDLPYEDVWATGASQPHAYRRQIEHSRTYYRRDDLSGSLPLGQVEGLALPFESHKLGFPKTLSEQLYADSGKVDPLRLATILADAGYIHSEADADWWVPSGRVFYSPGGADTFAQELAHARQHFFQPSRYLDAFGQTSTVIYDSYDLHVQETRDALGNCVTVGERSPTGALVASGIDYRLLQPTLVTDPNRNRSGVAFNALGLVVGTAAMGKREENLGDSLEAFVPDLDPATVQAHMQTPFADPQGILTRATIRLVYDLFAYWRSRDDPQPQPSAVYTLTRETHYADLGAGQQTLFQHGFSYSDGFGREIQKKVQAEPGPLVDGGPDVNPRWVGNGWTVFNNKGKPVREYEPFFSPTHKFEFAISIGVGSTLFYDPLERVVASLHPNHAFEKVVFDPWQQATWDVNDTVLQADPKLDLDVGAFFERLPGVSYLPTWYVARAGGAMGAREQAAATKTEVHDSTPTVTHFDTLGRPFLMVAYNRFLRNGTTIDEKYRTRLSLDVEGNERSVFDALGRVIARSDFDMLGTRVHSASMEAGERWMLNDVAAKPIYGWNSRGYTVRTAYDALRRQTDILVKLGTGPDVLIHHTDYGEAQASPEAGNLRGHVYEIRNSTGVIKSEPYDFKGNLVSTQRQLAVDYQSPPDWAGTVALEPHTYASRTAYDALNRPITLTTPDSTVVYLSYNEANLLRQVEANLNGSGNITPFVNRIQYNAKAQRTRITYGNGVERRYEYDPLTFRVNHLLTGRGAAFPSDCPNPEACGVQNLTYTYDPTGNVVYVGDNAQQTTFFRNRRVEPSSDFTYDAIYRLVDATGREHLGQIGTAVAPPTPTSYTDTPRVGLLHPGDGTVLGRYREHYTYDAVGNIVQFNHLGEDPANPGWTRTYVYGEPSALEPAKSSNRLSSTQVGGGPVERHAYDSHGNMTTIPHLSLMNWDYRDQIQATAQQSVAAGATPETTYYVYDANGQRVRKVTERQGVAGQAPTRKAERIYLGSFEIYQEYDAQGNPTLTRESLHVLDDQQRVALVETRTRGNDGSPTQLIRYQFGNLIGSACLELDDQALIVSYEEYYPYGSTSYQAVRSQTEIPLKRYRYTAKERDEETGFNYHGARYYAPWQGRWVSCDPSGLKGGHNQYRYAADNPLSFTDPDGREPVGQLMGNWEYGAKLLNRALLGRNVQLDHPIQVALRIAQRTAPGGVAYYNRAISAAQKELTVIVETGKGLFHTEVGKLQKVIRQDVLAGVIRSEADLVAATKGAYAQAAAATNTVVDEFALNKALLSNMTGIHRTTAETVGELQALPAAASTDLNIDKAFAEFAQVEGQAVKAEQTAGVIAQTVKAEQTVAALSKGAEATSMLAKAAPLLGTIGKGLGVIGKGLGKIAGPLGLVAAGAQYATAKTTLEKADAGVSAVSSALMMSKHPVAVAAGAGLAVGQVIENTLNVSDYSSSAGVYAYEKLKGIGVNDNVSFVAGAVVSTAAIPAAIAVAAADKSYALGKRFTGWLASKL